uniref:Secreted protein n=1 Tax=Anas zonorhyncha TaxID=75864 RepID=A0A8B9UU64_9AVES
MLLVITIHHLIISHCFCKLFLFLTFCLVHLNPNLPGFDTSYFNPFVLWFLAETHCIWYVLPKYCNHCINKICLDCSSSRFS